LCRVPAVKLYVERFLLTIFAAVVTALLTAHVSMIARMVMIGGIGALAFLASVVAEKLPPAVPHASLPPGRRIVNVLLALGIPILLCYVLLSSGVLQIEQGHFPDGSPSPTPLKEVVSSPEDTFMKKYVGDDGQAHPTGAWTVIILASGHNNFPELRTAAENALSKKGYAVRPLFRAALLQDSAASDELYNGNPALLKRIAVYRDGVLVGKVRLEISHDASLDLFTAHLFADLRVISARSANVKGEVIVDETGAGFSESAAASAAEQKAADKLKQELLASMPPS
jgi:hypothetical protein